MTFLAVGLAVLLIFAGLQAWICYQLVVEYRRRGSHRAALKARSELQAENSTPVIAPTPTSTPAAPRLLAAPLAAPSPEWAHDGLSLGTMGTDFDLPDLSGGRMTLSQWQGRSILLLFVDPRCPFSRELLAVLGRLPEETATGWPMPLVVTTGDVEENRRLVAECGLRCPVALQEEREVASVYRVDGTPMGYLLDEQRLTASGLAVGAGSLLRLAGLADQVGAERPLGNQVTRWQGGASNNDRGLAAGMLAPAFRLPRLGGGELTLEEHRGQPVLLVFSDPACRPCRELAPKLQRLNRRSAGLQVLMVSRGDPAANQAQAAAQRLTFPIALQRHWETSRAYRMSAAPIGYLIDDRGVIAANVAVGAEAILGLGNQPLVQASTRSELPTR